MVAAYEILVNPETRLRYDQERRRAASAPSSKLPPPPNSAARAQYTAQNNPYTNTNSFFPPPPKAPTASKPPPPPTNPRPGYNANRPSPGTGGWSATAKAYEQARARHSSHQSPHRDQFLHRSQGSNLGRPTSESRPVPPPPQGYSRASGGGAPPQAFFPDEGRAQSPDSRRRAETSAGGPSGIRPTPFGMDVGRSQSTRGPPSGMGSTRMGPTPMSAYSGVKAGVRFQTAEAPPPPPRASEAQRHASHNDGTTGENYVNHVADKEPVGESGLGAEWDRVRAPYATPGGEMTGTRFGMGLSQTKSNQESPNDAAPPAPSNLRRSGSLESLTPVRMRQHSHSGQGTPNNHVTFGRPSIRVDPRHSYSASTSPHRTSFHEHARSGDASSESRTGSSRKPMAVDSDDSEPTFSASDSSIEENQGPPTSGNRPKATNSRISARRPPVTGAHSSSRPMSGTDYRRSSGTDSERESSARKSRGLPTSSHSREYTRRSSTSSDATKPQAIPNGRLFGEQAPSNPTHLPGDQGFSPSFGEHLNIPGSPRFGASGPPPPAPPLPQPPKSYPQSQGGFSAPYWEEKLQQPPPVRREVSASSPRRPGLVNKRSDSGLEARRRRERYQSSRRPNIATQQSGQSRDSSSSEDWTNMERLRSRSAEGHTRSPDARSGSPMNIDPIPPAMMQESPNQPPPPPPLQNQGRGSFAARQASVNLGSRMVPPPPPNGPPGRSRPSSYDFNMESLRNTAPLGRSGNGLAGMDDLKADLPFQSRASTQAPYQRGYRMEKPELPKPPKLPEVSRPISGMDDWTKYSAEFTTYIKRFTRYDAEMHKISGRNQDAMDSLPKEWPIGLSAQQRAIGDRYMDVAKIQSRALDHRLTALDKHRKALETYRRIREQVFPDSG